MLVSAVQQSVSVIHTHISTPLKILFPYNRVHYGELRRIRNEPFLVITYDLNNDQQHVEIGYLRKELGVSGRDFCFPLEGMLSMVVLIKKDKEWHAQSLSLFFLDAKQSSPVQCAPFFPTQTHFCDLVASLVVPNFPCICFLYLFCLNLYKDSASLILTLLLYLIHSKSFLFKAHFTIWNKLLERSRKMVSVFDSM